MPIEPEALVAKMLEVRRAVGLGELQTLLRLKPGERTDLKRALRELVRTGDVVKVGKRFDLPAEKRQSAPLATEPAIEEFATPAPPLVGSRAGRNGRFVIGTLHKHEDGFGFVQPLAGPPDLFLPASDASRVMDGDLIRVQVVQGFRGKPAARLVDVIERRRSQALGTYVQRGKASYVLPVDRGLGEGILVPPTRLARDGDQVKVVITRPPTPTSPPAGNIVAVVDREDPRAEVLEAAYEKGFSESFPGDVERQASQVSFEISAEEIARRRDLRALRLVTVDGEDARDFDDAIYVEKVKAGWRLVVAIADVAHYVRHGAPMDHEALRRTTSVYFPNLVLPMLPERLSNGICSLKPQEDRLCMVCDMVFTPEGQGVRCVDAQIYEGVMKSAARCTYTEVAKVLDGEKLDHREFLRPDFERMKELTQLLIATRAERGSIDFDLPEAKVVVDERGRPVRLEKRPRNLAHRIVEEFMLAANEQVARYFWARDLPTVYRVHGEPNEEKLETFLTLARAHGFALEVGDEITGRDLNELLKKMAGSPEQRTLNFLLLRSMMQAVYSAENIGHFGLAAEFYLHFTSPIRRYPDLMVHRLLKEHWARGSRSLTEDETERMEERLDGVAARCSERERAAMGAERDVQSYYSALFMADKVGLEFDGTVAAVTDFGFFVELTDVFVEGLIRTEAVGEGGRLDAERHRIVYPSGMAFGLGTPVRVKLTGVNPRRRHIDFQLISVRGQQQPAERPVRRRQERRKEEWSEGRATGRGASEARPAKRPSRSSKPRKSAGRKPGSRRSQRS